MQDGIDREYERTSPARRNRSNSYNNNWFSHKIYKNVSNVSSLAPNLLVSGHDDEAAS